MPGHGGLSSGDSQAVGRQALEQPLPQSKAKVPSSGVGTGWGGGLEAGRVLELRVGARGAWPCASEANREPTAFTWAGISLTRLSQNGRGMAALEGA